MPNLVHIGFLEIPFAIDFVSPPPKLSEKINGELWPPFSQNYISDSKPCQTLFTFIFCFVFSAMTLTTIGYDIYQIKGEIFLFPMVYLTQNPQTATFCLVGGFRLHFQGLPEVLWIIRGIIFSLIQYQPLQLLKIKFCHKYLTICANIWRKESILICLGSIYTLDHWRKIGYRRPWDIHEIWNGRD